MRDLNGIWFIDRGEFDLVRMTQLHVEQFRLADCVAAVENGWLRICCDGQSTATIPARGHRSWRAQRFARRLNRWAAKARERQYDG